MQRMERIERQQQLLHVLRRHNEPLTGGELAKICGVTRQVVVHDIAILRASGEPIVSTPRGYWLQVVDPQQQRSVLSVSHPPEKTEIELQILVDHGIHVLDVIVEHPIYGELRGALRLSSRRDVALFLQQVRNASAPLLSSLTDGNHFHTVEFPDQMRLDEAILELQRHGIEIHES
jgi:transcriptional regulator of NAD metabolism